MKPFAFIFMNLLLCLFRSRTNANKRSETVSTNVSTLNGEPLIRDNVNVADIQGAIVRTFQYTGSSQSYEVLAGVNSLTITAAGAEGGKTVEGTSIRNISPGKGGLITSTVSVSPGAIIYVVVGGQGGQGSGVYSHAIGGFNGGGAASEIGGKLGGAGGGASDVRLGSINIESRIVVAGGGGGTCADK